MGYQSRVKATTRYLRGGAPVPLNPKKYNGSITIDSVSVRSANLDWQAHAYRLTVRGVQRIHGRLFEKARSSMPRIEFKAEGRIQDFQEEIMSKLHTRREDVPRRR